MLQQYHFRTTSVQQWTETSFQQKIPYLGTTIPAGYIIQILLHLWNNAATKKGVFDDISSACASLISYYPTDEDDEWRIVLLDDLLKEAEVRNLDQDEKILLDTICFT